ncbi:hypothetical protein SF83666_b65880 (plasmid) [Sinorhizobium fredii CCBAU 83666]|nr:hypothetical protein SF83666_b65880 [Sinorhizobium fredii CCBAU 83666]
MLVELVHAERRDVGDALLLTRPSLRTTTSSQNEIVLL